ncbi:zinc finger protein 395a isoform 2-T2 [Pholidichthys leucotaenia]
MVPKARLGKRSPFGALLSSSCPSGVQSAITADVLPGPKASVHCGRVVEPSFTDVQFLSLSPSCGQSVSLSIDVPRRARQEVDMDELMAAMVLSSLSCSPELKGPAHPNTAALAMDSGSELSDGGSGYWSVGTVHGSPAPSPTLTESDGTVPSDEGLVMEMDQMLFDEPAPRKRRNSTKSSFRCLWPSCGKELTSEVGIKRHIRTTHLCHGGEHERCSHNEEDFYYTEVHHQAPPPCLLSGSAHSSPSSPPPPPPLPSPATPGCSVLSSSAPLSSLDSFWQVQSEHSYQAPIPSHMMQTSTMPPTHWMAPATTCSRQGVRVRSVSVGEQWLQHQGAPCRKLRGEAKKCRKVYGIEHRDVWCTACRWKKACQRFVD